MARPCILHWKACFEIHKRQTNINSVCIQLGITAECPGKSSGLNNLTIVNLQIGKYRGVDLVDFIQALHIKK